MGGDCVSAATAAAATLIHQAGYLFPGIAKRRNAYLEANPDCRPIISLGIGDTTQVNSFWTFVVAIEAPSYLLQ